MKRLPRTDSIDSSLALLAEGYSFISTRCERLGTDAFETRLLLRKVVCARGEDAATMFYQSGRFTRRHAMPPTVLMLLQDRHSAQWLDGPAHQRRKQMFMSLMRAARVRHLMAILERRWLRRIDDWTQMAQVVLHQEAERLLCGAVCEWAGVPLTDAALDQRTCEFAAMIDGAGAAGPRNWRGMLLRARTVDWARSIITGVRADHMHLPADCPIQTIAWHRDAKGRLLDAGVAAIELINLLRPTVAVARFVTFGALALHQHPECRRIIASGDDKYLGWFVQEVRRFYPFFPAVGGRALQAFDWRGMHFTKGSWMLLDLYGTNRDPRIWGDPHAFRPERFRSWSASPFNFIPQGGGDVDQGHRCAGEWITIEAMKTAVRLLVSAIAYEVPKQDLRIDLTRMPAIPASRFIINGVRRAAEPVAPAMRQPAGMPGTGDTRH